MSEWISVKKRLPEIHYGYTDFDYNGFTFEEWESDNVLVTYERKVGNETETLICVACYQKSFIEDGEETEECWIADAFNEFISDDEVKNVEVKAWMPLPEAYKGG